MEDLSIAVRYRGGACMLKRSPARCCTKGFDSNDCIGPDGWWCELGLCSSTSGAALEESLGYPVAWERVEGAKGEGKDESLLLTDRAIYKLVGTNNNWQGCIQCDLRRSEFCNKYCSARDSKALCVVLNKFIFSKGSYFKKVAG